MSIFNREEIIDQNFLDHVRLGHLPSARTNIHLSQTNIRSSMEIANGWFVLMKDCLQNAALPGQLKF